MPVATYTGDPVQEVAMSEQREAPQQGKYAKLPPPIRPEDMRTSQEVRPQPTPKGEYDAETEWLLRTTGLFI